FASIRCGRGQHEKGTAGRRARVEDVAGIGLARQAQRAREGQSGAPALQDDGWALRHAELRICRGGVESPAAGVRPPYPWHMTGPLRDPIDRPCCKAGQRAWWEPGLGSNGYSSVAMPPDTGSMAPVM